MDGRTLWIAHGDVEGDIEAGHVVKATRPLADWCLRGDDGTEPVEAGTLLEIVELRPWGAAMAQELPEMHDELNVGDDDQWERDQAGGYRVGRDRAVGVRGGNGLMRFTITVETGTGSVTTTLPERMATRIEAIAKQTGRGVQSIIVDAIDTDTRDLIRRINHQGPIARMTQGWRDDMLATHRKQVAIYRDSGPTGVFRTGR